MRGSDEKEEERDLGEVQSDRERKREKERKRERLLEDLRMKR